MVDARVTHPNFRIKDQVDPLSRTRALVLTMTQIEYDALEAFARSMGYTDGRSVALTLLRQASERAQAKPSES
jgi:hypothetical protein